MNAALETYDGIDLSTADRKHGNNCQDDNFCCPHCMQSNYQNPPFEQPQIMTCPQEDCGKEFVGWLETETISCSGFLPTEQS